MKIGRLLADDPRCKEFFQMLMEYGLKANRDALNGFLMRCDLIEDKTPREINDRREYYRTVYLKTDHWKNLKKRQLGMVKACEICESQSNLDVHHRRYRNLYDVTGRDLAVLCRKCHEDLHASVDSQLRGEEKENALDQIFLQRLPAKAKNAHKETSDRIKFHDILKRMISVASKIRKTHGISLSGKIRPLFKPLLASEARKLNKFFLQVDGDGISVKPGLITGQR